jgi:hypothetical protein
VEEKEELDACDFVFVALLVFCLTFWLNANEECKMAPLVGRKIVCLIEESRD